MHYLPHSRSGAVYHEPRLVNVKPRHIKKFSPLVHRKPRFI